MIHPRSGAPLLGAVALLAATGLVMAQGTGQDGGRTQTHESRFSLDPIEELVSFGGIRTFADPSKDSQMGFTFPTEVREVLVKVGDVVEAGDVLIRARDNEAVAALEIQRIRAENDLEVQAAQTVLDLAQIELTAVMQLRGDGGGNQMEEDRAQNSVQGAEIDLKRAEERLREQQLQLDRLQAELERYYLVAPYDGVVQDVMVSEGESTNESRPALRLVKVDPLHLRVPEDVKRVKELGLEVGDPAWAVLALVGDSEVREGRIVAISPVTETGSQRLIVKVEVPNPDQVTAGVLAYVRFEPPEGEWIERMASPGKAAGAVVPGTAGQAGGGN